MMRAICLLALLTGIVWNVRFAIGDLAARRNQPEATRLAMRLIPENPAYSAQLADEVYAMDPASAKALLQRALQRNRYDAPHWIQLGLLSEGADELPQAEESLLEAAKVDATFLPGWSLANFYFRHANPDRFWFWAQKAAYMVPDDATPLFRLAWYMSPDVGDVERRLAISRPVVAAQFVNFLMAQGDAAAVAQAATNLSGEKAGGDSQALSGVCDWLLANRRADLALPLWNALAAREQIPHAEVGVVTNGSFARSPLSQGFDWHLATVEGVSSFLNVNPNALGFEFSGNEPDVFVLMSQTVPVQAQKSYALALAYSTEGIAAGSGITWQVTDERAGSVLAKTGSLAAAQGGQTTACFRTSDGGSFVNLLLAYQRQPGTVRVEGKLALHSVQLTAGPCPG
jgi:hypothetical protein